MQLRKVVCRMPQRKLAQGCEIARREIVPQGAFGILRDIDLSLLKASDQAVGWEVDELNDIRAVENGVGHDFAHMDARDLHHYVIQAFDMLDVDRGIDVEAPLQQLFDVLSA